MFDKYIISGRRRMFLKKLIWMQMLGLTGGSLLPWETFVGNPLQFNAPKAHTLKSLKVEFSPIQSGSGDPSPDNVRPISGWTGANIYDTGSNVWDEQWEVGAYSGANGAKVNSNNRIRSKNHITVAPSTTYYGKITGLQIYAYDRNKVYIKQLSYSVQQTFTTTADCYFITFNTNNSYGETYLNNISINYPSTDTEYHAYNPASWKVSVTWQDEAGTVYGGYLTVAEDGSVDLVTEWQAFDLSSLDWTPSTANNHIFRSDSLKGTITPPISNYVVSSAICSEFKQMAYSPISASDNGKFAIAGNGSGGNTGRVVFIDHRYSTVEDFTDGVRGVLLVSPILNPIVTHLDSVTQLTALVGINTMWTDADSLEVQARANSVQLNALQSLNMLLGGRYYNNGTADEPTDEEALDILLGR